jgi:hypothetical protein
MNPAQVEPLGAGDAGLRLPVFSSNVVSEPNLGGSVKAMTAVASTAYLGLCILMFVLTLAGCSASVSRQTAVTKRWHLNGKYDFRETLRLSSSAYLASEAAGGTSIEQGGATTGGPDLAPGCESDHGSS